MKKVYRAIVFKEQHQKNLIPHEKEQDGQIKYIPVETEGYVVEHDQWYWFVPDEDLSHLYPNIFQSRFRQHVQEDGSHLECIRIFGKIAVKLLSKRHAEMFLILEKVDE